MSIAGGDRGARFGLDDVAQVDLGSAGMPVSRWAIPDVRACYSSIVNVINVLAYIKRTMCIMLNTLRRNNYTVTH